MKIEVAIIPSCGQFYCVVVRTRKWYGLWSAWKSLCDHKYMGWEFNKARFYADQALENGVVPDPVYPHEYYRTVLSKEYEEVE